MGRSKDPEHTVELIIETSMRLFIEKGYEQTSIQDILDAVNLSKGALYHHFKSKEEILQAVMERYARYMENLLDELLRTIEAPTARERITLLIDRLTGDSGANEPDGIVVPVENNPQMFLSTMKNCIYRDAPVMATLIEEGIQDGSIQTEYPRECAEILLFLINYWASPILLPWNEEECLQRIRFLQHTMRLLGVDIISDTLIDTLIMRIRTIIKGYQAAKGAQNNE